MGATANRLSQLEEPLQLPVGDEAAELPFLPLAGVGIVVDEGVPEQLPRRARRPESLDRRPEGRRELVPGGILAV